MAGQTDVKPDKRNRSRGGLHRFLRLTGVIEDALLVSLLSLMIAVAAGQILLRNLLDVGLSWGDQLSRVLVLWVGLLGAASASRENKHINIAVLLRFLSPAATAVSQSLVAFFTALVCALMAFHAGRFVYLDSQAGTVAFGIMPLWMLELILPVGFGLIGVRYLLFSISQLSDAAKREDIR